ncbi:hypothetical protein [Acerihabitans arboris]|uniref:Uncharacterized protein n=1 Tax=Acerihabitans arboris TaxID=2691583 RepID=A0A845SMY1_9GAMM|nr:hypothetical protein [Acerihabitans arboris]NDL63918.1 hypothetical protein [Acerihabitans arboris]
MLNKIISRYNHFLKNESHLTAPQHANAATKNNYYEKINKVHTQIHTQSSSMKNNYSSKRHRENYTHETFDDKIKADRLFYCVALFKKHPESLSTAKPGINIAITIADRPLSIPSQKIALPGGDDVYVAVVAGRWLVSDGERYYIDDLVCPPHSWQDTMVNLLAHLAGVVRGYQADRTFPGAPQATRAPPGAVPGASGRLTKANGHGGLPLLKPVRTTGQWTRLFPSRHLIFLSPSLPGADAVADDITGPAILTPWNRLLKNHPAALLKRPPRAADDVAQQHSHTLPLMSNPPSRESQDKKNYICETNLHIANHAAKGLYTAIKQQYIPLAKEKIYSLGWMSSLNIFLYDKITELFNDASYLDNIVQFTDIIMIKRYIENSIEECIKSESKKTQESDFSRDYFKEQRTVSDFFPSFSRRIETAVAGINFKIMRELIDFKNGISYADAKTNLQQLIKESPSDKAVTYKEQYSLLVLMQESQNKYERLLISDSIPLIDRLIYFNTREIYLDMLDEQPINLRRILIKRFFYYIFEYSRNSGLSMQGNYLIIPGELTEYSSLFDQPDPPLSEEEIAELVATQIVDFIHGNDKYNPHIGRLVRDIEFFRTHPDIGAAGQGWQEESLQPYKETLQYLEKSAATNLERLDNPEYAQNPQWSDDLFNQVKYDKECVLLLSFLEKLQTYLIDIVAEHQHEQVLLGSKTDEQRLAEAKIMAMIMAFPEDSSKKSKQEIINQYFNHVTAGNIELLLRAAIYWYIDYNHVQPSQLSRLNSLFIIKEFQEVKKIIALDFEARSAENFKKIFELKPSSEFNSAWDFYNQFTHYKDYSLRQEARQFTYKILSHSELDYLDMIYPPKEVYTFKIYSRNYVQNSLAPNIDVYSPNNNFGTFSLIRTYTHHLIMACAIFSAPFIKKISTNPGNDLLDYMFDEHKKTNFGLNWINRRKIPVTEEDLLNLFDIQFDNTTSLISPLSLFLIRPEQNIASMPTPDYVLVAGNEKKEYKTLVEILDHWNAQMLEEIMLQLKKSLREKKWWQQLLALIPFYEVLWKHCNDANNEINGIEVIFDTFDLAFMIAQLANNAAKGVGVLYKRLLNIANIDTMSIKKLNSVVSKKLAEELLSTARKSSGSVFNSITGYLNPLPIHTIFSKKVRHHLSMNMATVISWMSNFVLNNMEQRMTKFILWSAEIDRNLLSHKNNDGTFILNQGQGTTQSFIEINDNFFQVIWDAAIKSWRVVKPTEVINSNYAVPMYRNDKDKWISSYFLDNDRFPISTRSGRRIRHLNEEVDNFSIEPLRVITFPKDHYKDNKRMYIYMLELMLNNYMSHMKSLFDQSSDISKMLTDLVECLTDVRKFREIFVQETDSDVNTLLLHFVTGLALDGGVNIAYRMQRLWQNEHDRAPVDYIVLVLKIKQHDFIVDIMHLRPYGAGLIEDRQAFNEPEWTLLIKKTIANDFPLIKYKDFTKIKSAIAFPYREAGHPGKYIKDAFLLREPIWYKTVAINYYYRYVKEILPAAYNQAPSILSATRSMISSYDHLYRLHTNYNMNVTFPFLILKEANILNAHETEDMQQKVTLALGQNYPSQGYMSSSVELLAIGDLLKIKAGKLLAIFYDDVFLSHLLLSVGDGRFAGVGNNLFNPLFETGPSIIMAEEMGIFAEGKLRVRNTDEQYTVVAGNPFNAPVNESIMSDRLAFQTIAKVNSQGEEIIEEVPVASREKILTQDGWTLAATPDNTGLLTLKMEAVPQNIYPLDAGEMAHIIRGLFYVDSKLPAISQVQCIELITIFDGLGTPSHLGQILANGLRIDIQLCPYLATPGIRQRQPHWFTRFSGATINPEEALPAPANTYGPKEHRRGNAKLKRLADMVEMLITVRKSLHNARIKRNVNFLPAILSDLARLIIRDMNFYDFTGLYQHQLDNEDEENIYHILKEYQDYISEGDEYYLQCYFDILLAVVKFRRLAEMIYPMPAKATNGTLPLWPYA